MPVQHEEIALESSIAPRESTTSESTSDKQVVPLHWAGLGWVWAGYGLGWAGPSRAVLGWAGLELLGPARSTIS